MGIALTTIGAALAAFCIWLTVRTVNRRERWARRTLTTLLIGLPVLYVTGFGPAVWLTKFDDPWAPQTAAVYWPLGRAAVGAPPVIRDPLVWYAQLFAQPFVRIGDARIHTVPTDADGKWTVFEVVYDK